MVRPKEFDEDAVLLKAMHLFWDQGYEKTSMQELISHMGIHRGSLYDTFGDKRSLYIKTLKRYSDMLEQSVKRRLAETHTAKEAIRLLFEMVIQQREELPDGCFITNTAVELAQHDAEAKECVQLSWNFTERLICNLIEEGQRSGELAKHLQPESLSFFLNNALIGLRVMVKSITDKEKLEHIVETNMSILN
ncbi:TetR/AcrR family transcriptional regulator [Paenibacillus sp. FJAT-27812]|uniref:TetR/AcrR family transcriptional regulator n=1 Tax=Paenibacillus sp. FJAT-27812 TaxID=1684143 RepID=UPI0006A7E147|nr:TetR/AcrR family transcriptional regulator [Paenibacillus sp. FJAT-27812]